MRFSNSQNWMLLHFWKYTELQYRNPVSPGKVYCWLSTSFLMTRRQSLIDQMSVNRYKFLWSFWSIASNTWAEVSSVRRKQDRVHPLWTLQCLGWLLPYLWCCQRWDEFRQPKVAGRPRGTISFWIFGLLPAVSALRPLLLEKQPYEQNSLYKILLVRGFVFFPLPKIRHIHYRKVMRPLLFVSAFEIKVGVLLLFPRFSGIILL